MKKTVMKKWVKALRSGEYSQGEGQLVDSRDNFCCLGVLCNLAPTKIGTWLEHPYGGWAFGTKEAFFDSHLPKSVMKWSGMNSDHGRLPCRLISLMNHNDRGMSFSEIADLIEKNWEKL